MTTLEKKQGSVVGVSHDMMIVRYNSKGVLFKKNLLIKRTYKVDDIVQFNARKAATVDIEVSDKLARISGYNIEWVGTEIKYIKTGRTLAGEGVVLNIPENGGQYMFVDWKFTQNPPKSENKKGSSMHVFVTRSTVRPEIDNLNDLFRAGQKVKYIAKEQAPNERGVCWRASILTDDYHEIVVTPSSGKTRHDYQVVPKADVPTIPGLTVDRKGPSSSKIKDENQNLMKNETSPSTPALAAPAPPDRYELEKPPPVDGFDYFDTSEEACIARFKHFANTYRDQNPTCLFSQKNFEGMLKIKYLNQLNEQLSVMRAAYE